MEFLKWREKGLTQNFDQILFYEAEITKKWDNHKNLRLI